MALTFGFELETLNKCGVVGVNTNIFEIGTDTSVPEGREIRTKGGSLFDKILDKASTLLGLPDIQQARIGEGCSFHVHVGGKINGYDISQTYVNGHRIIRTIEYQLLSLYDIWPEVVKTRMAGVGRQYAGFTEEEAVIYNSGHNTLEFRIFGNVSTIEDAHKCIEIAAIATTNGTYEYNKWKKAGLLSDGY